MAEGSPSRPRFFLDEEKNSTFLRNLEERRTHVPSDAERQSAAAVEAIVDDDEDDMESSTPPHAMDGEQPSHVVDLGPDPSHESASKPSPTVWSRLQAGWLGVEDRLVEWFGLDQSKYQWAVDEFVERQMAGDNPTPKASMEGLQLQEIQEQTMQRDVEVPK